MSMVKAEAEISGRRILQLTRGEMTPPIMHLIPEEICMFLHVNFKKDF